MKEIQPIKRVNVSDQVFDQLKDLLVGGVWQSGDKIPSENELSEKFQVSRVTIRQALQRLTALGLIETRFGEGSFVREIELGSQMNNLMPQAYLGKRSTLEVLEFRQVVETEAAGLAASRATEEDIAELEEILNRMIAVKHDSRAFAKEDLEFHIAISRITRNSLIIATHSILNDILSVSMQDIVENLGYEIGLYYHRELIEALQSGDADLASQVMRKHIITTRERLLEAIEQKEKKG